MIQHTPNGYHVETHDGVVAVYQDKAIAIACAQDIHGATVVLRESSGTYHSHAVVWPVAGETVTS